MEDDRVDWYKDEDSISITFKKDTRIVFDKSTDDPKIMVVLLSKMKLPPSNHNRKNLSKKVIGQMTGITPTWVSELIKRYETYGIKGLGRLPKGGMLDKAAENQLLSYISQDCTVSIKKWCERLKEDGYKKITPKTVKNTVAQIDPIFLLSTFRKQKKKTGYQGEPQFLVESLISIIDQLLPFLTDSQSIKVSIKDLKEQCKTYIQEKNNASRRKHVKSNRSETELRMTSKIDFYTF